MIGIYKVTNLVNQKSYIGQSTDILKRWKSHRTDYDQTSKNSYDTIFYRAIRKYGLENFSFEILEECSKEELNDKEKYYIHFYNTYCENNNGYNMTLGGNSEPYTKISQQDLKEIYNLLRNTKLSLRQIAEKFSVNENTIGSINKGYSHIQDGINYPIRSFVSDKSICYCKNCNRIISPNAKLCRDCYNIEQQKVKVRPSGEELSKLLQENLGNFTKVGKLYNVSDNTIRKWCKKYEIPFHSCDYK